jgi:hypothetical protein
MSLAHNQFPQGFPFAPRSIAAAQIETEQAPYRERSLSRVVSESGVRVLPMIRHFASGAFWRQQATAEGDGREEHARRRNSIPTHNKNFV